MYAKILSIVGLSSYGSKRRRKKNVLCDCAKMNWSKIFWVFHCSHLSNEYTNGFDLVRKRKKKKEHCCCDENAKLKLRRKKNNIFQFDHERIANYANKKEEKIQRSP